MLVGKTTTRRSSREGLQTAWIESGNPAQLNSTFTSQNHHQNLQSAKNAMPSIKCLGFPKYFLDFNSPTSSCLARLSQSQASLNPYPYSSLTYPNNRVLQLQQRKHCFPAAIHFVPCRSETDHIIYVVLFGTREEVPCRVPPWVGNSFPFR